MHTALVEDKVEFVKLFIDNGLSLRTFITPWRLLKLYNDVSVKNHLTALFHVENITYS